jgi:PAS domain S-box-containing protein
MSTATQFAAVRDHNNDPRYRAMFEAAEIGIAICRLDGRILEANPALSRMLGYSPQELAETHASVLHPEIARQPYSGDFSSDQLGYLVRGEREWFQIEKLYQRRDGSELWGSLTVSLARDARCQPAYLIAMLADATDRRRVEEHLRQAGKMEVIGRLAGGIAHDFNNLLTGILLYCDLLSAGLEGASINSENGIAPIENERPSLPENRQPPDPLVMDSLQNDLLQNDLLPSDLSKNDRVENEQIVNRELQRRDLSQHVNQVRMAGQQGAALTHQLLAIARQQAAEPRPVLINEVVAATEILLRRLIGEQVELVVALDDAAGPVLADRAQMGQVLLNLVLNSRDAMPQGGRIWLTTRSTDLPGVDLPGSDSPIDSAAKINRSRPSSLTCNAGSHSDDCSPTNPCSDGALARPQRKPGKSRRAISLMVKDNGCGMNAEARQRLFEPFFTTKNPGQGTGLGMATVQRIVAEAGGRVAVESTEGGGTCIEVFFPAIEPSDLAPPDLATSDSDTSETAAENSDF